MAQKRTVSSSEDSEEEKKVQESKIKPKSKPESDDDDEEENEKAVPVKEKKHTVQKHAAAVTATHTKKPQSSSEADTHDMSGSSESGSGSSGSGSGSESQSGSGSESESSDSLQSPTGYPFTLKPFFSKPVAACSESKKPASKSTSQLSSTPAKPTGKRSAETLQNGKESRGKKSKVSEEDSKTEEKKSIVTRVWSDKDEIAILDGMVRYKSEKGSDPTADTMAFKEFLKDSIRADITKSQLSEKIRRLKKKYLTNAEKGENGEDPVLLRPHDYRIFEISKKIWGSSSGNTNAGENNGTNCNSTAKKSRKIEPKEDSKSIVAVAEPKAEQVKEDEEMADEKDLYSVYPRLYEMVNIQGSFAEDAKRFLKENIGLIGSSKAKEMEEKWKKLQIEEFEVYSKRVSLISEQNMLVLDALKSSKN